MVKRQTQLDLITSWVLMVREPEEPGMTAGILCGPALGTIH